MRAVAFTSNRGGSYDLYIVASDGSVATRCRCVLAASAHLRSFGRPRRSDLDLYEATHGHRSDSSRAQLRCDVVSTGGRGSPALSPNGAGWPTRLSNRPARVWSNATPMAFPCGLRTWRPASLVRRWRLFYLRHAMMQSPRADDEFYFGRRELRQPSFTETQACSHTYDVARDGRFLMIQHSSGAPRAGSSSIVVVENWLEELKQRVPTSEASPMEGISSSIPIPPRSTTYPMISPRSPGHPQSSCLRQVPGDVPNWRLNARLNAASDS